MLPLTERGRTRPERDRHPRIAANRCYIFSSTRSPVYTFTRGDTAPRFNKKISRPRLRSVCVRQLTRIVEAKLARDRFQSKVSLCSEVCAYRFPFRPRLRDCVIPRSASSGLSIGRVQEAESMSSHVPAE